MFHTIHRKSKFTASIQLKFKTHHLFLLISQSLYTPHQGGEKICPSLPQVIFAFLFYLADVSYSLKKDLRHLFSPTVKLIETSGETVAFLL